MNVFNIIGPVMIGPSSSHTAGACRLGRVAHKIMNEDQPEEVTIELSGSFARTYRGHGTDRALLAGIMGYHSDDKEVRDALEIAKARGLHYSFVPCDIPGAHPNTARIHFRLKNGREGVVMGASVGGGNIRIDEIDGLRVNFTGDNTAMLVVHDDVPGVIAAVTNLLSSHYAEMNICNFNLTRSERGGTALMTLEFDQDPPENLKMDVSTLPHVRSVSVFHAF